MILYWRFTAVLTKRRFGGIENKLDNMATKDDVASLEQQLSIIQTKLDRALYTEPVAL